MSDTKIIHGSLDEIVEAIKQKDFEKFGIKDEEEFAVTGEDIRTALERFVQPDGWISVEDRLPERYKDVFSRKVLVYNDMKNTEVAYYDYELNRWTVNPHSIITHWMPLPEPPKKGGDDGTGH